MNNFAKGIIVGGIAGYVLYKTGIAKKVAQAIKEDENKKEIAKAVAIGAAAGTACAALYTMANVNNTCRKLNMSVEDMANRTDVEISDNLVAEAVAYAATKKADLVCNNVAKKVEGVIEKDMHDTVSSYVNNVYSNVKGEVRKKLKEEVSKIDVDDLREEIIDEAKSAIASKFDKDLERISDKYADNLDKMSDIYSTVAESIKDKFQNV